MLLTILASDSQDHRTTTLGNIRRNRRYNPGTMLHPPNIPASAVRRPLRIHNENNRPRHNLLHRLNVPAVPLHLLGRHPRLLLRPMQRNMLKFFTFVRLLLLDLTFRLVVVNCLRK